MIFARVGQYFRKKREEREHDALTELKARYHAFRIFLENNGRALELIVAIDGRFLREKIGELRPATEELLSVTSELVDGLNLLSEDRHSPLYALHGDLAARIKAQLEVLEGLPARGGPLCAPLGHPDAANPALFGKKAANLARLRQMSLPVPDGFVCSTSVCRKFLAAEGLVGKVREQLRKVEMNLEDISTAARKIREMVLKTSLPEEIENMLEEAYLRLCRDNPTASDGPLPVSVRSSGVSEDGAEFSFAGQYTSVLNVRGMAALVDAYREVIASAFSARAVAYRRNVGMSPVEFDLAVLCQVMFEPHCAGVLFTRDPSQPDSGRMLISAVPGLGTSAVGGSVPADIYRPPRLELVCTPESGTREYPSPRRDDPQANAGKLLEGAIIARKTVREVAAADGGLATENVPDHEAEQPLLSAAVLEELARFGEIIERLEQHNGVDDALRQDIEWAWSERGGISILQARPLRLAGTSEGRRVRLPAVAAPLLSGTCASAGKAIGQVRVIHSAAELQQLHARLSDESRQPPCILVLPQSIVDAVVLLKACTGLVVDVGNPTDHLSCVAREYGVPMLTGTETAVACLRNGQWIILDADNGQIFHAPDSVRISAEEKIPGGRQPKEAVGADRESSSAGKADDGERPEWQAFRELIVPLHLTDAFGPTFSIRECRSIHDIIRYTHEMAVLTMFNTGDQVMEYAGNLLHPLEIGIPFSFLVIDVGGGTRVRKRSGLQRRLFMPAPLTLDDILSIPLKALCEGLITPGLNWHSDMDQDALPGLVSRTMLDSRGPRPVGSFNYALTARDYLNLNARLEFHFAMLDAVCGRDTRANYIRFRFKGGGASQQRSHRRALFLQHVLERNAFYTTVVGDLVTASLTGVSKEIAYQRLVMLGRLFGFSRFLDGVMTDDEVPLALARQFLDGEYACRQVLPQYMAADPQ